MKKAVNVPYRSFLFLAGCLISGLLISSCNNDSSNSSTTDSTKKEEVKSTESKAADATITGTEADTVVNGTAHFTQGGDGKVKLELSLEIPKLPNHTVAVHIHEHGDCGEMGKASHGHWNPTGKQHGKWGSAEFHLGDIGNVTLDGSGKGTTTLETDLWSIGGDANKDILNKAIIVHSGTDDYTSQPAGNAGSRIGCGLIQQK